MYKIRDKEGDAVVVQPSEPVGTEGDAFDLEPYDLLGVGVDLVSPLEAEFKQVYEKPTGVEVDKLDYDLPVQERRLVEEFEEEEERKGRIHDVDMHTVDWAVLRYISIDALVSAVNQVW